MNEKIEQISTADTAMLPGGHLRPEFSGPRPTPDRHHGNPAEFGNLAGCKKLRGLVSAFLLGHSTFSLLPYREAPQFGQRKPLNKERQ